MALDRFGRRIHYLRISLTDHCNLRCRYCMPEEVTFQPKADMLQDEEILHLVRLFAQLGFDKIRLTGGEPTMRAHIVDLVREIASTPGIRSLSMTTNGVLFSRLAKPLAEAGLQRVNFSLDTLNAQKFAHLTRWGELEEVWKGIQAAESAGLHPIKINVVVVRDYNEPDVIELARLTLERNWQVRYIEMMPFGGLSDFQQYNGVEAAVIKATIEAELGSLIPLNGGKLDGEARLFRLPNGQGDIGFISTVSQPFCASCTRLRLTADGHLRMCLLREVEVDLLKPLRGGASDTELRNIILETVWNKPWGHRLSEGTVAKNRTMSQIGG